MTEAIPEDHHDLLNSVLPGRFERQPLGIVFEKRGAGSPVWKSRQFVVVIDEGSD